jgi:hypothetical protein
MSFNICRGTLGSLAMFTAIRNASSRVSTLRLIAGSFSALRNVVFGPFDRRGGSPAWSLLGVEPTSDRSGQYDVNDPSRHFATVN